MSEVIAAAPRLFALRDEIVEALIDNLTVNATDDVVEIEGHDRAAEEIIMRLVGFLSDEAKALGEGQ